MKLSFFKIVLFTTGFCFSVAANAQSLSQQKEVLVADANTNLGVLKFFKETIDYGTIKQNTEGTKVFKFTNTGKKPIVLTKVKPSCGCTASSYSKEPILPNETSEITVKYDTKRLGHFSKSIKVYSNSVEPIKTLKIKGNIIISE